MCPSHARAAASRVVAFALFAHAAATCLGAQAFAAPNSRDALAKALDAVRASDAELVLPPAAQFTFGDTTIAARSKPAGTVAVANGTVHVRGIVDGDVVAYAGEIIVHQGGEIHGNAIAILGKVTFDGGHVDGESRSLSGDLAAAPNAGAAGARSAPNAMVHEFALAGGWLAVLVIVGIGVLVFASSNLDTVSDTLERNFGRALLAGVAAQLALFPMLAILLVGLALTLIGILLIPFAVVAYVLAAVGLVTLGYLAIANITGRSLIHPSADGERARRLAALQGVLVGLVVLMSPWFVAAALSWSPIASVVSRTVAIAVTWVACSAGLGAALISRGGVRRIPAPVARRAMASAGWQTPTPVAGVTAARRPTPMATPGQK
jgi:hypothetical protein